MGSKPKPKENPLAIAQAEVSAQEWLRYKDVFRPFEDELIGNVMLSSQGDAEVVGRSATNATQSQDATQRMGIRTNALAGGMGSGRSVMGMASMGNKDASENAFRDNKMGMNLDLQNMQNMSAIVSMGRGQAAQGLRSLGALATTQAARDQDAARQAMQAGAQRLQAVGQVAGMAAGGFANSNGGLNSWTYNTPIG